jgi:hypothetical protein
MKIIFFHLISYFIKLAVIVTDHGTIKRLNKRT